MRRIFVALGISKKLQDEISRFESKKYPGLPVRWLSGDNLHITLVPPWDEEKVDRVKEVFKDLEGQLGSFEVKFGKVTYGPDPKRPRLIWAGGEMPERIIELKKNVERVLAKTGEHRPFLLHLTLARFREEDFPSFPVKKIDDRVDWMDEAKTFVLMESHLSPVGADYETLAEFAL